MKIGNALLWIDEKTKIKLPDTIYLKLMYKYRIGKKLNLKNPKTFNEKLQWLKLYNRNPAYVQMVDKYEAKKYVASIIGEEYIIPTLGVWDKFDDIDFTILPNKFVLKCTHDSGGVVICKEKNNFNIEEARKKINKHMKINYYYHSREWPYKNVKPRIIAEQYMKDENNEELLDFKFMCFNGIVKMSFVCSNRKSKDGLNVDFYDLNWNKMPFQRHYQNSKNEIKKPKNYELMIELAEKLSKEIPFVRADFYEINGKVYFGELTFFPGAGLEEFTPELWDEKIGDMLVLPKKIGEKDE